mgnify:CR=1 FL=1
MKINIDKVMLEMTLEEKASLCSGFDFWTTKAVDRLGISAFTMTDGPNGVRKQEGDTDHLGLNSSTKATCFPTGSCLAATWDVDLLHKVGAAIGREAKAKDVSLILGPAINMKRSPLCGRNFEYLSEDPILAGKLSAAYINGLQKEHVGATPKHYIANNQETLRMTIDSVIDERALREIYLKPFEIAIKEGKPWMLMTSYNRVNGEYTSESKKLLKDILRDEWQFDGVTVTDWYSCDDRVAGILAGQDLEMPGSNGINDDILVQAVKEGRLEEAEIDIAVKNYLIMYNRILEAAEEKSTIDFTQNHKIAIEAAAAGTVLLKNADNILPLKSGSKVAVIGDFAINPRYQGGGSSHLNANQMDLPLHCIQEENGYENTIFAQGYDAKSDTVDENLIKIAVDTAKKAETAVIFCGLTEDYESEGYDRTTLGIPEGHTALIQAVAKVQPNTIVVLQNGSPIEMVWADQVKAIVESYLGGEACGSGAANILFGKVNPSGKLAETFPLRLQDNPTYLSFPGYPDKAEYKEGVFIGYRYYSTKEAEVLFPFGHGLSYTSFAYSDLQVYKQDMEHNCQIEVECTVQNTGNRSGSEVVQVYIKAPSEEVHRPALELKGFAKVPLEAGEKKSVRIPLYDIRYWQEDAGDWKLESGTYEILVGASSQDIRLKEEIKIELAITGEDFAGQVYDRNSLFGLVLRHPVTKEWALRFKANYVNVMTGGVLNTHAALLVEAAIIELPLRTLVSCGHLKKEEMDLLIRILEGKELNQEELKWLV